MIMTGFSSFLVAGISSTLHNLSSTGPADGVDDSNIKAAGAGELNAEICAFCHTPHGASSAFSGAPLWNKGASTGGGFALYGSGGSGTTLAGTTPDGSAAAGVNAPSMACLSCHDGVSAINSIVNAPGSGGYVAAGSSVTFQGDATDKTMPAGITQIGRDLSNDHPVSIEYLGDGTATSPASLKLKTDTLTGWIGATTIADLLRTTGANADRVECGSCHDPHSSTTNTFLRINNTGSALCLGCHAK